MLSQQDNNGHQMMIIWHVENLKISHKDGWEITKIINWLGNIYGIIKVKRGQKHNYLGMDIDFGYGGVVTIWMILYVEKLLRIFLKKWEHQLQILLQQNIYFK